MSLLAASTACGARGITVAEDAQKSDPGENN
jgi:hypothetical protein